MRKSIGLVFVGLLLLVAPSAQAAIIWNMVHLNSGQTFGPNDTVRVELRFTNSASSTGNFTSAHTQTFGSVNQAGYTMVVNGNVEIGLNVAPGGFFDATFPLATWTPVAGGASPGVYNSTSTIGISIFGTNSGVTPSFVQIPFTWTVVPEPSRLVLFASCLLAATAWAHPRQRVREAASKRSR